MKLGIMQPYFFAYMGYYQLINTVDEFIIYDNIKYTKKGWINRNRILLNGKIDYISLPLKKDSNTLDIVERSLADCWTNDRKKMINKIRAAYSKAPMFSDVMPLINDCIDTEENNLFKFIYNSIKKIINYLDIKTPIYISSELNTNDDLKAEERVIDICQTKGATTYINAVGGTELYTKDNFKEFDIELKFIKNTLSEYKQFNNKFVAGLSIIDIMMFNDKENIKRMLLEYQLV